jgi:hypothetical protein
MIAGCSSVARLNITVTSGRSITTGSWSMPEDDMGRAS